LFALSLVFAFETDNSGMGIFQRRSKEDNSVKTVDAESPGVVRDHEGGGGKSPNRKAASSKESRQSEEGPDHEGGVGTSPNRKAASFKESRRYRRYVARLTTWIPALILLFGAAACGLILGIGITASKREQEQRFKRLSKDLVHEFAKSWEEYITIALWIQQVCRSGKQTRNEFHELYEHVVSTGLDFEAIALVNNVTRSEKNESSAFIEEYYPAASHLDFITGENYNLDLLPHCDEPRPFHFSARYAEPVEDNWDVVDLDFYADPSLRAAVDHALTTYEPVLTAQIPRLPSDTVVVLHPGVRLYSDTANRIPHHLSMITVRIHSLLTSISAQISIEEAVSVYVYDSTNPGTNPHFLGGAKFLESTGKSHHHSVQIHERNQQHEHISQVIHDTEKQYPDRNICERTNPTLPLIFNEERSLEATLQTKRGVYEGHLHIATREWIIAVVAEDGSFEPELGFVYLGSTMNFVACACLALWMVTNYRREVRTTELNLIAEAEKAATLVENARKALQAEREFNDFIAHEVRNPLSAAISATSFVSSMVSEENPLSTTDTRQSAQEDVRIIEDSLEFINDLLRNMLDMHRASSNQLTIDMAPTDLLRDVLEPVVSMLYHRCGEFEVLLDCPKNLVVMTDRLRLKQIVLNLGRNAAKFVKKGFVRLRADFVDGMVQVYVEDSGPGISLKKRTRLFSKYQESLNSLNQGTGIGLSLCETLVDLMQGEIALDEKYESGMEGFPGSRFVIKLNTSLILTNELSLDGTSHTVDETDSSLDETSLIQNDDLSIDRKISLGDNLPSVLPENLSVLFVDDDMLLRKLFSRSIRKLMPSWKIEEAGSGERSLRLVDEGKFDLIFMDQYMTSADNTLLGTETVQALRKKGVKSRICGLSANDVEKLFLQSGANHFLIKPFPCAKEPLMRELLRILYEEGDHDDAE
jgi:signal transduction histidine kinase/CheY-like chemotaxis protein